ncbi:hypothetical protein D9611_005313 [Ephemerocybe angulata]|uniref:Uncharacterized protein n=1 Tax=Ephemerocybe angulata TaxID=980116 RepID=A0A8H5C0J3_9AGAR|nr:hypothetical protein D9611_005313 [Tulosesus angulatus]
MTELVALSAIATAQGRCVQAAAATVRCPQTPLVLVLVAGGALDLGLASCEASSLKR